MGLDLAFDFAAAAGPGDRDGKAGESLLFGRFRHWRGRSGRSYVFSVYAPQECPAYENAVLMIVARRGGPLACVDLGAVPELTLSHWRGLCRDRIGEVEFQVHVLADRAAERKAVIEDLSPLCA